MGYAKELLRDRNQYILKINVAGSGHELSEKGKNGKLVKYEKELNPDEVLQRYGDSVKDATGKIPHKHVRKLEKSSEGRTYEVYSISGPLNIKKQGIFDFGTYSISNNTKRIVELANLGIKKFLNETRSNPNAVLNIQMKGLSRGAVAVTRAQPELLKNHISKLKPEECKKIRINSIMCDPVPGPFHTGKNVDISLNNENLNNSNGKNVVIYSLCTNNPLPNQFFVPQIVKRTNILIFLDFDHAVGTYHTNENKKYKFKYGSKEYSYGMLIQLPNGVYYGDKDRKLEKIGRDKYSYMCDIIKNKTKNEIIRCEKLLYVLKLALNIYEIEKSDLHKHMTFKNALTSIQKSWTLRGAFNDAIDLFTQSGPFYDYIDNDGKFFIGLKKAKSLCAGIGNNNYKDAIKILDEIIVKATFQFEVLLASKLKERIKRYYNIN